jgi:hypothetical protein
MREVKARPSKALKVRNSKPPRVCTLTLISLLSLHYGAKEKLPI